MKEKTVIYIIAIIAAFFVVRSCERKYAEKQIQQNVRDSFHQ